MSQNTCSSWPEDFDTAVERYWDTFNNFIRFLAARLGVWDIVEDIIQDFWLHAKVKWYEILAAQFPFQVMRMIARRKVYTASYRDKVRVHMCFVPDVDVEAFLTTRGLERAFTLLQQLGPTGLPVYSGLVWRSMVEELSHHPDVAYLEVVSFLEVQSIDDGRILDPKRSAESIEARTEIQRSIELIRPELSETRAEVARLIFVELLSPEEVARRLGVKPSVVKRYCDDVSKVLREECPWLNEYF